MKNLFKLLFSLCFIVLLFPEPILASSSASVSGEELVMNTYWWVIPFAGLLLSLAIMPQVCHVFWENNYGYVILGWAMAFLIPLTIWGGFSFVVEELAHMVLLEYIPFIALLLGLYIISGGIVLRGTLEGTPKGNTILLAVGTLLSSWIGTTGASMLLIRPLLRSNKYRQRKAHLVIFFIFLVANIGGCLTPIGDPPLFLGYLRGVPFFWTLRLLPLFLLNALVLLGVFYLIDSHYYKKEDIAEENFYSEKERLSLGGVHNLFFLALVIFAVIACGAIGTEYTVSVGGIDVPISYIIEVAIIVLATVLSVLFTKTGIYEENSFSTGPAVEVAVVFFGIFVTMIPVLSLLTERGLPFEITGQAAFFWGTGLLSTFLDNAPTYLLFLSVAAVGGDVITDLGPVSSSLLMAISAGAVFMGANTYTGNAPNFMIRSIAERDGISMPHYFKYMGLAFLFLMPLFIIDTLIFFL